MKFCCPHTALCVVFQVCRSVEGKKKFPRKLAPQIRENSPRDDFVKKREDKNGEKQQHNIQITHPRKRANPANETNRNEKGLIKETLLNIYYTKSLFLLRNCSVWKSACDCFLPSAVCILFCGIFNFFIPPPAQKKPPPKS